MISLLYAAYLAGAAALAVPILLHLLRRRPRQLQPFPSFRFIHASTARKQSRNNLRKWLVLLLRCLVLALLALAFSWPYLPKFRQPPRVLTVVLWDDSFSMQASPYRVELRGQAVDLLGQAGDGRPVAMGAFGDRVQWSGDFTEDPRQLYRWFDEHPAGQGTSRLDRALRLADRKLEAMPAAEKRILLVTDRQLVPWQDVELSKTLSPGVRLNLVTPRRAGFRNVAICEAQITAPLTAGGQRLPLRVRLRNYHSRPVLAEMTTTWAGQRVDRRTVEVEAMGQATVSLELTAATLAPQFGKVQLKVDDDLQEDNTAWFVANPARAAKAMISPAPSGETDYIRLALCPSDSRRAADIRDLGESTAEKDLQDCNVMILREAPAEGGPLAEALDRAMRRGATVLAVWRDNQAMRAWLGRYGVSAAAASQQGTHRLAAIDFEHPVFMPFLDVRTAGLFNVLFFDPPQVALPPEARVLAQFDSGLPALAELAVGDGRLIVLASDLSRQAGDWPVSSSFLPLWRQMLAYAQQEQQSAWTFAVSSRPTPIGPLRSARNLEGGKGVELQGERFIPLQPGAYLLQGAAGEQAVAVNVPAEESDPLVLAADFPHQRLVNNKPAAAQAPWVQVSPLESKSFWWALLVAALAAAFSEVILANRTTL